MDLIYGTHNPAKLYSMIKALGGLELSIIGLDELHMELMEAEESGKDPMANAVQKAVSYYEQIKRPVFSCDSDCILRMLMKRTSQV